MNCQGKPEAMREIGGDLTSYSRKGSHGFFNETTAAVSPPAQRNLLYTIVTEPGFSVRKILQHSPAHQVILGYSRRIFFTTAGEAASLPTEIHMVLDDSAASVGIQ